MTDVERAYKDRLLSDEQAVSLLEDGGFLYVNGGTGLPNRFMQALVKHASRFRDVRYGHPMRRELLRLDPDPVSPELADHLFHVSDFAADLPVRQAVREGRATYRPNHPTDAGPRFPYDIDLLVAAVAPMDGHGFFNFGLFGGWIVDFLHRARRVVVEVNPNQPTVHGPRNQIHVSAVAGIVEADYPVLEWRRSGEVATPEETAIAGHIAALVEDGATLQIGAGKIPEAVARLLIDAGRKDLGVHSEMLYDWVLQLHEAGVVTNARKSLHRGKIVGACATGSQRFYDFLDRNPAVELHPISYTNDPRVIAQNYRQVSVNATLQVDLFGQCASETLGPVHYGGTGGQWNFHYGASLSEGGVAIMTMPSTAKGGSISRIVPMLPQGSIVSIPRNDVEFIATEHGIVHLKGRTLEERARLLISIADPRFREQLEHAARDDMNLIRRRAVRGAPVGRADA